MDEYGGYRTGEPLACCGCPFARGPAAGDVLASGCRCRCHETARLAWRLLVGPLPTKKEEV